MTSGVMPANRGWRVKQLELPLARAGYREGRVIHPSRARLGQSGLSSPLQIYTALIAVLPLLEVIEASRLSPCRNGWTRKEVRRLLRHFPDAATYAAIVQDGMGYRPPWETPPQTGTKREPVILPDL